MAEEYIYWVDKNNRFKGKISRENAHSKHRLHRIIYVLLFNKKGELLIQKRGKTEVDPGSWDASVSGHVRYGESYSSAALRELREEIGVRTKNLKELFTTRYSHPKCYKIARVYQLRNFSGKIKLDNNEAVSAKFLTIEKVRELVKKRPSDFTPTFKKILSDYLKLKKKGF